MHINPVHKIWMITPVAVLPLFTGHLVTYRLTYRKGKYLYVIVITSINCDIFVDKIRRNRYVYCADGFRSDG